MSFDLHQWYDKINNDKIFLSYQGTITGELVTEILEKVEEKLIEIDDKKIRKKMYNVVVEILQNLFHHIDEPPDKEEQKIDDKYGAIVINKEINHFKVTTGNFIRKEKTKLLKDRLDQINFLSINELKTLYRLILNNQEFSEKGGGGLGMIDIARKTGNKLNYNFLQYNNDYRFFTLDVVID